MKSFTTKFQLEPPKRKAVAEELKQYILPHQGLLAVAIEIASGLLLICEGSVVTVVVLF